MLQPDNLWRRDIASKRRRMKICLIAGGIGAPPMTSYFMIAAARDCCRRRRHVGRSCSTRLLARQFFPAAPKRAINR
ncbi:MAG TPA: hypothetical protein VGH81_07110 [Rudaea sp.]